MVTDAKIAIRGAHVDYCKLSYGQYGPVRAFIVKLMGNPVWRPYVSPWAGLEKAVLPY